MRLWRDHASYYTYLCLVKELTNRDIHRHTITHPCTPNRYQDYQPADIPVVESSGARVRVMAGDGALGQAARGPIHMRNPGMLLDVSLQPGATFEQVGWSGCRFQPAGRRVARAVALVASPWPAPGLLLPLCANPAPRPPQTPTPFPARAACARGLERVLLRPWRRRHHRRPPGGEGAGGSAGPRRPRNRAGVRA